MTTPQPPTSQAPLAQQQAPTPTDLSKLKYYGTPEWIHNSCIAVSIVAPIAMFLPPRRVGIQALVLSGTTFWTTSQLAYDWTGESIKQRFLRRVGASANAVMATDLPEKAKRTQELLRAEKARQEAALPENIKKRLDEERAKAKRSIAEKIWLGDAKDDWAEERKRKEKEALEDGRGYGGLIMDHIKEVWYGKADEDEKDAEPPKTIGNEEPKKS